MVPVGITLFCMGVGVAWDGVVGASTVIMGVAGITLLILTGVEGVSTGAMGVTGAALLLAIGVDGGEVTCPWVVTLVAVGAVSGSLSGEGVSGV